MKSLALLFALSFASLSFAHEGGHGELAEGGKYGGVTAPVFNKSEETKGSTATVQFKAELVRAESGKLSLYVFDKNMKLVDLSAFGESVEVKLEMKKKGKFVYFGTINLSKNGNHYTGQLPKVEYKPFNLDLYFAKGAQQLFVGFPNLD